MDGGAWWAAVHGVAESWTRLSDFTFTFHFHALEKETATHSNVLAWRIPGMGEPGASEVAQWDKIHLPVLEMLVRSLGLEYPLEKEVATHSSILAWRIPWTEEPAGL